MKELELRIYEGDGVTFKRGEIIRVTVLPFSIAPLLRPVGGALELVWNSVEGWNYRVERCTDLAAPVWSVVGGVVAGGEGGTASMQLDLQGGGAFYRVRLE